MDDFCSDSILMALTYLGGDAAQIDMGLPNAVTGVFQGMLLFYLLAADVLVKYRVRVVSKKPVILKTEAVE